MITFDALSLSQAIDDNYLMYVIGLYFVITICISIGITLLTDEPFKGLLVWLAFSGILLFSVGLYYNVVNEVSFEETIELEYESSMDLKPTLEFTNTYYTIVNSNGNDSVKFFTEMANGGMKATVIPLEDVLFFKVENESEIGIDVYKEYSKKYYEAFDVECKGVLRNVYHLKVLT